MAFRYAPASWKFLYAKPGSIANGSFEHPYLSFNNAVAGSGGSTLWIGKGTYSAAGITLSSPMTLRAATADLELQPDGSLGPGSSGWVILR